VAEVAAGEADAAEYPGRQWIAQSLWHGVAVRLATDALEHHFRDRDDVLVAMELAVYYKRGERQTWMRPDVQVVFGVERGRERSSYRVWEERKAPDFVLEVASPSTADKDALDKAQDYASIGVLEYWRLDPQGSMMREPLEGYRARGRRYRWVESVEGTGGVGYLRSRVLGLDLRAESRNGATVLVIRDPATGEEFNSALEESERRRRLAEEQLIAAKDRASVAEKRIQTLEQQLRELTGQVRRTGRDS